MFCNVYFCAIHSLIEKDQKECFRLSVASCSSIVNLCTFLCAALWWREFIGRNISTDFATTKDCRNANVCRKDKSGCHKSAFVHLPSHCLPSEIISLRCHGDKTIWLNHPPDPMPLNCLNIIEIDIKMFTYEIMVSSSDTTSVWCR